MFSIHLPLAMVKLTPIIEASQALSLASFELTLNAYITHKFNLHYTECRLEAPAAGCILSGTG